MVKNHLFGLTFRLSLSILCALPVWATPENTAGAKEYFCRLLTQAPELDGHIVDDPVWQDLPVGQGYRDLRTGLASAKQTAFRVGYTSEAMFIGIVCEEPAPDEMRADMADGERFRGEDSLTLFLATNDETMLVFAVNAIGSRTGSRTLKMWQAVAYIGEDSWSAEIMLPWEVLGTFPAEGEAWGLNICRSIASQRIKEYSTWADLEYRLDEVENLGELRFEAIEPDQRRLIEARIQGYVIQEEFLLYSRPGMGVVLQSESSENRVVYNQGPHIAPRLSPDTNHVLFNSVEGGEMGVWLVDRGGNRKERICNGRQAAWSPDGTKIVFQRDGRLVERALASGEEHVVSPEGGPALAFPSYVPDGGIPGKDPGLRFICTDETGRHVYLLAPDEEKPLETLLEGEIRSAPRCSPDGTTLAFQDGAHVRLMDLAIGEVRQLTVEPGVQACPVWATDGRSLCYARAHSPLAEAWDICHVETANPLVVSLIERKVHPGFDWSGSSPGSARTKTLPGTYSFFGRRKSKQKETGFGKGKSKQEETGFGKGKSKQEETGFGKGKSKQKETGFGKGKSKQKETDASGPEHSSHGPLDGRVEIENDWLILHVSREGAFIALKGQDVPAKPMALRVTDRGGRLTDEVADIRIVQNSGDSFVIKASFLARGNQIATSTIRVPRTRPFIEVVVDDGAGYVGLQADMALAIVPDRFSNDLVLDSEQVAPGATTPLPQTPIVLGCLADSDAMVMLVASSDMASFAVTNSEDGTRLTALTATPEARGVVMAVLARDRMWQRPALEQGPEEGRWRAKWKKPFHAQWRMAVCGVDAAYARMWNVRDLGALGREPLPIEGAFDHPPETAVVYAWGRDVITPAAVLTPMDILLDVWGIEGCLAKLDIEGIRGYRLADEWAPFRELTVHQADWHPAKARDDGGGFGVLETMGSVFPVGTDGVRSFLRHMGNDAVNLLRGLENRIGEYEQFLGDLAAFCLAHQDEDRHGFLASVGTQANDLLKSGRDAPKTDIAEVDEALEKVLRIVGARDNLTLPVFKAFCQLPGNEDWAARFEEFMSYLAAKEGRLWHNDTVRYELWYEGDFKEFSRRCRKVLAERQGILSEYRTWAKRTRDGVAQLIISHPELKATGDELRRRTHALLRNRYYLEGDWRGETPLPTGAL